MFFSRTLLHRIPSNADGSYYYNNPDGSTCTCDVYFKGAIGQMVAQRRQYLILPHFPDYNDGRGNARYTPPSPNNSPRRVNAPRRSTSSAQEMPIAPIRYEYRPPSQGSPQNRLGPPRRNRYSTEDWEEMPSTPTKSEHSGKLRKLLKKLF